MQNTIPQRDRKRKTTSRARKLGSKRKLPDADGHSGRTGRPVQRNRHASSRPEVAAALYALAPSFINDDDQWLKVGRALCSWDRSETTLGLWTSWSTRSGRRTAAECRKQWDRFGQARQGKPVTIDVLFRWAAECGWTSPETSGRKSPGSQGGAFGLAQEFLETGCTVVEDDVYVFTVRFYREDFYRWRGGRYVKIPLGEIRNALVRFLGARAAVTTQLTAAVLDSVKALTEVPAESEAPFWLEADDEVGGADAETRPAPENLIAARNGLVDVPAFLEHRPSLLALTATFFCTSAVNFDFNPDGTKPKRWLRFLRELWKDDSASIDALQEWAGYLVMGRTELQKIQLIVGPPRSGKGTIAKVLTELVGKDSAAAPKLEDFSLNFGLAPLLGKRLAIIPDARLGSRHDEATLVERLLSISGEDTVTIDRKHRDPVTVKLGTRITILTNELPGWADTAGALASRLIVLRLTKRFVMPDRADCEDEADDPAAGVADPTLWSALQQELPAILRWALRGWQRLEQRGYFVQPESGRPLLEQAADVASPIHVFVRDECTVAPHNRVVAQDLYNRWKRHCERTGEDPGTLQTFCKGLRAVVPTLTTERKKSHGRTTSCLIGIAAAGPGGGPPRHCAPPVEEAI